MSVCDCCFHACIQSTNNTALSAEISKIIGTSVHHVKSSQGRQLVCIKPCGLLGRDCRRGETDLGCCSFEEGFVFLIAQASVNSVHPRGTNTWNDSWNKTKGVREAAKKKLK